jgi:ADP-heptose:LPS heptosyltransferase
MASAGQFGRRLQRFKGMERGLKTAAIRVLAAVLPAPAPRAPPDWDAREHRVLYLRYDRIGDMILATGIIEAIVRAHPSVKVDVLASPTNAAVLQGNPHVGRVVLFDKQRPWTYARTLRQIRRARYDAVLDAMVLSPSLTTAILMLLSGARHRVGVAGRGSEFALTLPVPRARHAVHYVDHSAGLLSAFGIDPHARSVTETIDTNDTTRATRGSVAGNASRDASRDAPRAAAATNGQPHDRGSGTGEPTVAPPATPLATPLATPASGGRASGGISGASLDAPVGGWGVWRPRLYLSDEELAGGESQWSAVAAGMGGGAAGGGADSSAPGRHGPWRLAVNVSAGDQTRYWPSDRFISALKWMRARFPALSLLLIGSPRDLARMEQIGHGGGVPLARTPSMRDMMAVVATADIVFTADTSVTHVASAYDKPAVVMFPRGRGALYGPYGTDGRVVSTPGPTLQSLAEGPVLAALAEVVTQATDLGAEIGGRSPLAGSP